jgi:hypothetical protein
MVFRNSVLREAGYSAGDSFIISSEKVLINSSTTSTSFATLGNDAKTARMDFRQVPADVTLQARVIGRLTSQSSTDSATFRVGAGGSAFDRQESELTLTDSSFNTVAGPPAEVNTRDAVRFSIEAKHETGNNGRAQGSPIFIQFEIEL